MRRDIGTGATVAIGPATGIGEEFFVGPKSDRSIDRKTGGESIHT